MYNHIGQLHFIDLQQAHEERTHIGIQYIHFYITLLKTHFQIFSCISIILCSFVCIGRFLYTPFNSDEICTTQMKVF